MPAHLQIVNN